MVNRSNIINYTSIAMIGVIVVLFFNLFFKVEPIKVKPTRGLEPMCVMIDKSKHHATPAEDSIDYEILGGLIRIEDFYIKLCGKKSSEKSEEERNGTENNGVKKPSNPVFPNQLHDDVAHYLYQYSDDLNVHKHTGSYWYERLNGRSWF